MRCFSAILFIILSATSFSQKVALTQLSFKKTFELEKAPTSNVLKDYTQFSESPFTKIPKGFTLSDASVFYKFDTLNCSLFIKKREDIDSLYYYRDCEDGGWCSYNFRNNPYTYDKDKSNSENIKRYRNWQRKLEGCCDLFPDSDTTALFYRNEFVNFPEFLALDENIPAALIKMNYVTNKEYKEFIDYIVDSTRRTRLAQDYPNVYYKNFENKYGYDNVLNYSKSYSSTDPDLLPKLSQFYWPDHEKYYRKRQLDTRKIAYSFCEIPTAINYHLNTCEEHGGSILDQCSQEIKGCGLEKLNYSYNRLLSLNLMKWSEIEKLKTEEDIKTFYRLRHRSSIIIYPDTLSWLKHSSGKRISNYSIWASEDYFRKKEFENLPVQGVNYWQAKTFLSWKTKFHNQELIQQNLPYRVLYTLPLPGESVNIEGKKIVLHEIDMDRYIITNKEYEQFVFYVSDSVIVKMMAQSEPAEFSNPSYDDNGDVYDETNWHLNKKWFKHYYSMSLNKLKSFKYFKYIENYIIQIDSNNIKYQGINNQTFYYSFMWRYYDKDTLYQKMNRLGDIEQHVYGHDDRSRYIYLDKVQIFPGYDIIGYSQYEGGKAWKKIYDHYKRCDSLGIDRFIPDSLDPNNQLFWELNTRYFEYQTDYPVPYKLYDFKSNPSAPITAITYEQAKAYYYWKNEVPYIPTKEELEQIKQGINPYTETELEVPGPFFRYVIRVYPVRE